jgi:hypothetical protein
MLKRKLLIVSLVVFLTALPLVAQDSGASTETQSTAETTGNPSSATTAVLLLGIVAVLAVGGYVIRRENANQEVD